MAKPSVGFFKVFLGQVATHPLDWLESLAFADVEPLLAETDALRRRALYESLLAQSRERLTRVGSEPVVRESLFLAKPLLSVKLERHLAQTPQERAAAVDDSLERNLASHLSGTCAAIAPQHLQAGGLAGTLDARLKAPFRIRRSGSAALRGRRTLAAPDLIARVAARLTGAGPARWFVRPRPNPTWHADSETPGTILFRRAADDKAAALCRLDENPLIAAFFEEARGGRRTARRLVTRIAARFPEATLAQIEDFYGRLCEQGALVGHLEIPFRELDALAYLIRWLARLPATARPSAALRELKQARMELALLDRGRDGVERRFERYRKALDLLGRLAQAPPESLSHRKSWIVDGLSAWSIVLGKPVLDELSATIQEMTRIFDSERHRHFMILPVYQALRRRFADRQAVPLTELYGLEKDQASKEDLLLGSSAYAELIERLSSVLGESGNFAALALTPPRLDALRLRGKGRSPWGAGRLVFRLAGGPDAFGLELEMAFASPAKDLTSWRLQDRAGSAVRSEVRAYYRWLEGKLGGARLVHALYRIPEDPLYDHWHSRFHRRDVEIDGRPSGLPPSDVLGVRELEVAIDDGARTLALRESSSGAALQPTYEGLSPSMRGELDPCARLLHDLSLNHTPSLSYSFALPLALGRVDRLPRMTLGRSRLTPQSWICASEELAPDDSTDPCEDFLRRERWRRARGLPRQVFVYARSGSRLTAQFVDFWNPFLASLLRVKAKTWPPGTALVVEDAGLETRTFRSPEGLRFVHELRLGFWWDDV